jgi:hypothetical protein
MSAPVYEFTCTACHFNGLYASGTGERVYLLPDGSSVHVPWDTGWCSHCQTIRSIQRGMSPPELEAECRRLETEAASDHRGKVGNWEALIHRLTVEYPLTSGDLDRGRKLLALLAGRTSLNACEHCRCTAVEIMHWGTTGPSPTVLPYSHPECGGQLMVKEGMRISWAYGAPLVLAPVFADARPEDNVRTRYSLPSWKPPKQRRSWFVRLLRKLRGEHYSVDPLTGQEYMLSDEVRAAFKEVEGEKSPAVAELERVLNHRDMRDHLI